MSVDEGYLTVVELKRYAYCPRIVFITHVLHHEEVKSEAMEMGSEEHYARELAPLISKLKAVNVFKDVELASERLGIVGKLDYLLLTRLKEYVPVEVKWAESENGRIKWDHKLQLAAYALLVEENFNSAVKRGYVYYLREHRVIEMTFSESLKKLVAKIIQEMYDMIENEKDPGIKVPATKCFSCGYKAYCRPGLSPATGPLYKESQPRKGPETIKQKSLKKNNHVRR